jgi:ubiquitin C-terminal hydrolase
MSGIENIGNTCFAAAVIQLFRYCKPLVKLDLEYEDEILQAFCNALYHGYSVTPFLQHLPALGYPQHEQHDANEFMMMMIDKLFPEENPFEGQITSILECAKGHTSVTKYAVSSILVHGDVREGLVAHGVPEPVDAKCEKCGGALDKRMSVTCGEVLLIQIARFSYDHAKLHHVVHIPPVIQNKKKMYLTGVIHHEGNLHSGHYIASVHTDDGWKLVNDESVSDIPMPTTSSSAYVLMYV